VSRSRSPSGSIRQRVALAGVALVCATTIAALLFGSRGLLHLRALKGEERVINQRIAARLLENQRLRDQLRRLRSDDRTLERLAREQLGLVRPGEIVVRFPAPRAPDRGAPPR
jgi:cell division protein FtsB